MENKKSVAKSIRLTVNTYNFINSFDGNGFNEKLEKMCYRLQREQKELDTERERKISDIKELQKHIQYHKASLDKLNDIYKNLKVVELYVKNTLECAEKQKGQTV